MRNQSESASGWGSCPAIAGDFGSVLNGTLPLREGPCKIYVVVGSIGALDVALGAQALANARSRGPGVKLGDA
jgi:hypothetical protein